MIKRLTALAFIALVFAFTSSALADVNVTFQVNMGIQMQIKAFDPATDTVVVRGSFGSLVGQSDWAGNYFMLTKSATNDSIYTLTVPFPDSVAGKTISFKYVIVGEPTGDNWEAIDNRTLTFTSDANQAVPLSYFNNRSTVGITVKVTIVADMSDLLNQGFNPSTDSIEVRGDTSPLNWGPGVLLSQDLLNPTQFKVDLTFTGEVGTVINWKFHCDPQSRFTNTGWEGGDNHVLHFPSADTTVGPQKPDIQVGGLSTAADTIYFRVNMAGAHERYHNTLITGLKSVWVGGGVPPLQWPSNWLFSDTASGGTLIKLYDDGNMAHGDSIAGDNIYSTMQIFPPNSSTPIEYKYGAVFSGVDTLNGGASYLDNEAGFGLNHKVFLKLQGGAVYLSDVFGGQATGITKDNTNSMPSNYTLSQNYPNPFNPTTNIKYSIPTSGMVTLKIYNILGQEVATLFAGFQSAGSYTANFDASKLSSGVYMYRLQAGKFSETRKMLLMK